jgi:hypothetical protein
MTRLQSVVLMALLAAPSSGQLSWAQEKSRPVASPPRAAPHAMSGPSPGAIADGVYRNASFGFSYKLPYGWVDRTADLQDDTASQSRVLMAIFERPPLASGDTINSAVVIAAETLPVGMKTVAEYFDSLAELAKAKGFQTEVEPYEFPVGATRLVRGDFSRARGTLTIRQASLVLLQKGSAVSFTFIGGSADEVNELIERLSFPARKSPH